MRINSLSAFFLIALIYGFVSHLLFFQRIADDGQWTNLTHDTGIYYAYLPATFIKKDPLFSFLNREEANIPSKGIQYWALRAETGAWIPKMTMGKAIMDTPFFFIADAYTRFNPKHERNGFSIPYRYAIMLSTLFYALFGLFFLYKSLILFFNEQISNYTLVALAFTTNFYLYSTHESGLTHPHTFFLLSAAIFLSLRWNNNRNLLAALLFGIVCGLIVLLRPVNILLLLPLPFFALGNPTNKVKYTTIWTALKLYFIDKYMAIAVISAIIIWLPQLIFWKIQSGSWLLYSYGDEGFFFSNPQIINGLFSFRKGWLIYTPIMFFALLGLRKFLNREPVIGGVISMLFIVFLYITFSWWCWWYGGGFSARTLIDFYPLLAFGMAAFIGYLLDKNRSVKIVGFVVLILFIGLNLFQSYQYKIAILHADGMNWATYQGIFLKTKRFDGYYDTISIPNYDDQKRLGEEKMSKHGGQ